MLAPMAVQDAPERRRLVDEVADQMVGHFAEMVGDDDRPGELFKGI